MGSMLSGYARRPGRTGIAGGLVLLLIAVAAPQAAMAAPGDLDAGSAYALLPPAPQDVPPLAEGAQECVRTSLVENYAAVNLAPRTWSVWILKGPGARKKGPTRKMRLVINDSAGNPGNRDMSCVGYLDASPTIDIWLERRKKGSKKPRKVGSEVKTVEVPIDLLRTDIFGRNITLKLNYQPVLSRDDWVLKTKECADPIGGEIECRARTWKFKRIKVHGRVALHALESDSGVNRFRRTSRPAAQQLRRSRAGGVRLLALASPVFPGDLDPSFGVGGKQTTDFGGDEEGRDIAVQPDGKIVVTGVRYIEADGYESTVARYNVDGSLDSSFSGYGVAEFESGVATAAALQLDGRIVVVGYVDAGDFKVVRYNADGSLDTTFSDDGRQTTDFGGEESVAGVALQADGKILVVGDTGDDRDFAIARYNPDGSLDATFSDDGLVTTDLGSPDEFSAGVAVLGDGTIMAAGSSGLPSHFAVVRYNIDGSLDTTFSGDGKQITDLGGGEDARDVVLQGDGKIVVVGDNDGEFLLVRYDADGSLDTTFAGDGKQATGFDSVEAFARGVALQADGKLVVVGRSDQDFALARYNGDGSLDTAFSDDGRQTLDFSGGFDMASAAAIQADGKIVAVGQSSDDFALARFEVSASSLDIVPPETTITAGPTGVAATQAPSFAFASSEPGSTFECRVDGSAFTPCTSPHSVGTLSAGAHTFEVRAIDSAGNLDPTPAFQGFTVELPSQPPADPPVAAFDPPQLQPDEQQRLCKTNALARPYLLSVRYVVARNKRGVRKKTREVRGRIVDPRPIPNISTLTCAGTRTTRLYHALESDHGVNRLRRNSPTMRFVPGDEADLSQVAFERNFSIRTTRPYKPKQGRRRSWALIVVKTWKPEVGPLVSRRYTIWFQKWVKRKKPPVRVG